MGVIHVISKYKDGDWKIANNDERGRSLAIANYRPIIHNDSADFHYVIISYGSRVEDYSKDTIYIKDTKAQIMKIKKYFATQSNSNIYLKFLMLDADAPLIEQVKQLASYIDDCSKDEHVKSLHILGQSKCGVMNMYLPRYFNNPRSFEITNIYNLSTPYVGTLLASPLVFYPMVHERLKNYLVIINLVNLCIKMV